MIRLAKTGDDFELCAEIFAEVEPDRRVTAEQLATSDGALLVSAHDGYAYVTRSSVESSAFAMVRVRPAARRRGVGSALLRAIAAQAATMDLRNVWGDVHEGDTESLRFVTARGFREVGRDIAVRLTLESADGAWAPGIVELAPEHLRGAYDVVAEATPEMALPQIAAARPFEEWVEHEERRGAVAVVALDGEDVVGYARLYLVPGHDGRLENGLTAVRKTHRRRGIATAMKRAQIAWAVEHGYAEIDSDMVEGNVAMRGVNERLGYLALPASIVVEGWPT
jgi:mycothiol synthase